MGEMIFSSFDEFLDTKGISKVEFFNRIDDEKTILTEQSIEDHIKLISDFHMKTMGFNGYLSKRLNNYTGKRVEEFKVYIKRLKRDIKRLKCDGAKNEFEGFILRQGEDQLNRAEKCISQVFEWEYYDLIDRSMKRIEICIGNSYHDNIRKNENLIEILDTKHTGYNMVECDCIYYLSKLKRKGIKLNFNDMIRKFCKYEGLGPASEAFIASLLSYPHEFMRSINKYRYRKKDWTDAEYMNHLISAIERDGDSLLD